MTRPIIYCADAIARFENWSGPLVFIERLSRAPGLAFPGGKQEDGETLSATVLREFYEETGLHLTIEHVLGTYAEDDRDPRGHYVATVFVGVADGKIRHEPGKTHVHLLTVEEALKREKEFVFDNAKMLRDYIRRCC